MLCPHVDIHSSFAFLIKCLLQNTSHLHSLSQAHHVAIHSLKHILFPLCRTLLCPVIFLYTTYHHLLSKVYLLSPHIPKHIIQPFTFQKHSVSICSPEHILSAPCYSSKHIYLHSLSRTFCLHLITLLNKYCLQITLQITSPLTLQNPTGYISFPSKSSDMPRTFSKVHPCWRSRDMAADVTSSFVWLDSISDKSTWNRNV